MKTVRKFKWNKRLTDGVIRLQACGYGFDFLITPNGRLLCIQNNESYPSGDISITLIDQVFDQATRRYSYIHAIDTGGADRGVLVADRILFSGS